MSAPPTGVTPESAALIDANIDLGFDLLQAALDDPSSLDKIANDATVVVIPSDDPTLAQHNLSLAVRLAEAGRAVYVHRVGIPTPDTPAWQGTEQTTLEVRSLSPRWPAAPPAADAWIVTYFEERDELIIDLYGRRQPGIDLPIHRLLSLWVNPETEEIMGYVVPRFVREALPRAPQLARLLAHAEIVPGSALTTPPETSAELTDEVGHLIA